VTKTIAVQGLQP